MLPRGLEPTGPGWRPAALLARAAIVVLSLALTLGLLEIAVRLWFDEGMALVRRDPVVGQRFRPSLAEDVYSPGAGRVIHRRFNRLGFRGPDRAAAKTAGVRRVAVLGDSFVASTALDEADTLPVVLERRLAARAPGTSWEAFNFGVDAFSPGQSLLTWRSFARDFAPDVVVFCFFNGNDVSDGDRRRTNYPRPYFSVDENGELRLQPAPAFAASASRWLGEHSRLYVWQKKRVQHLVSLWHGVAARPPFLRYLDPQPAPEVEAAWQIAERVIAALAGEVRATGARFILVSIPDVLQLRDDAWDTAARSADAAVVSRLRRDYPEARLGTFAAAHRIPFVALRQPLLEAESETDVFMADGHWNEAGIATAADLLAAEIAAQAVPGAALPPAR